MPANGLKLVVIAKSEFLLRAKRIVRARTRDSGIVEALLGRVRA